MTQPMQPRGAGIPACSLDIRVETCVATLSAMRGEESPRGKQAHGVCPTNPAEFPVVETPRLIEHRAQSRLVFGNRPLHLICEAAIFDCSRLSSRPLHASQSFAAQAEPPERHAS